MSEEDPQFCPHCDVSLDLHPTADVDQILPVDCEGAEAKAQVLDLFYGGPKRGLR